MKSILTACIATITLSLCTAPLCAYDSMTVDFYRTQSDSSDEKMITMTQDLFFTQLSAVAGVTVNDRRDEPYTEPDLVDAIISHGNALVDKSSTVAFFAEIQESADGSGTWICTVNGINTATGRRTQKTGTYSSYYKILLDAKNLISYILDGTQDTAVPGNAALPQGGAAASPEAISGSWASSEQFIDKVMILRGGRGFVIFKNGATMNITVRVAGSSVEIEQTGRQNASFFPDLPRELALESAASAPPVKWTLTLSGDGLSGTKSTLVMQDGAAVPGTVAVQWNRK